LLLPFADSDFEIFISGSSSSSEYPRYSVNLDEIFVDFLLFFISTFMGESLSLPFTSSFLSFVESETFLGDLLFTSVLTETPFSIFPFSITSTLIVSRFLLLLTQADIYLIQHFSE
ncbi:hypothetical protein PMAYCL1PPCAC_13944, partial [Pristionchus mayeri]